MIKIMKLVPVILLVILFFYITGCQKEDAINAINEPNSSVDMMDNFKDDGGATISCVHCTRTVGYWKTHSQYGPAPADTTWLRISPLGPDAPFYGTGLTCYQVLWTSPRGNAYFILAHQWLAVKLNALAGANRAAVEATYQHAKPLLDRYDGSPYPMRNITGSVREDFIATAKILEDYNRGLIGPGHCPD